RLLGDQCCALQAAAGSARRNVFASVNANGCRRGIEVGLKHARMICFALGIFKRRGRRSPEHHSWLSRLEQVPWKREARNSDLCKFGDSRRQNIRTGHGEPKARGFDMKRLDV